MSLIKKIIIPSEYRKRTTLIANLSYDIIEIHTDCVIGFSNGQETMRWYFENYSGIDFVKANMNSQFAQIVFLTGMNSKNRALGPDIFATQNANAVKDTNRILICSGMFSFSKSNNYAMGLSNDIKDAYNSYKQNSAMQNNAENTFSSADEIMKYKTLLYAGVITQEEFEMKKKQILNL